MPDRSPAPGSRRRGRRAGCRRSRRRSFLTMSRCAFELGQDRANRAGTPCDRTRATAPTRGNSTAWSRSRSSDRSTSCRCSSRRRLQSACRGHHTGHGPEPVNITCSKRCAKPGAPLRLVLRSDVVPDVHRHGRRRPIDRGDDGEPIWQGVGFERDLDRGRALCQATRRRRATALAMPSGQPLP